MPVRERIPFKRLFAEGVVIVVSVLLALAADAWLDRRREDQAVVQHLHALQRDFGQMRARMDSVLNQTGQNIGASRLVTARVTTTAPPMPADSLYRALVELVDYAVFSPSTASYASLTATGQIELLEDRELKALLAEFFGYFEDFAATEAAIQRVVFDMLLSPDFAALVGYDEVVRGFGPEGFPTTPVDPRVIAESRALMNYLGVLSAMYYEAFSDYEWMSGRIDEIRLRLPVAGE